MTCPQCGHVNPQGFAFCGGCGRPRQALMAVGAAPAIDLTELETTMPRQRQTAPAPSTSAAQGPGPDGHGDSTRYVCTAMHLDSSLASRVVRDIVDNSRQFVARSPGVNVSLVARHALAARRRQLTRDVLLTALAVLVIVGVVSNNAGIVLGALVAAWVVVFIESLVTRYAVVARSLSRDGFRPEAAPTPTDPRRKRRVQQIAEHRDGNVLVYSGFSPFVGCGVPIGGWSFAVDVTRAAEDAERPAAFATSQLRDHVTGALKALKWPAIRIDEVVIVSGRDLRGDRRFLADPYHAPSSRVDPGVIEAMLADPEDRARPYLHAQVAGWDGDLIASLFLRLVQLPCSLFVEASYSLLAPVQDKFHEADRLPPQPTVGHLVRLAWQATIGFLVRLVAAPFRVGAAVVSPIRRAWRDLAERRAIAGDLTFDYGADISVRELVSDKEFQRYFQRLDKEMYVKVLEKRVLDAVVEFLRDHCIDTSELVERTATILNNGVIVTGTGQLNAENVAVGAKASAGTGVTDRVRHATGRGASK